MRIQAYVMLLEGTLLFRYMVKFTLNYSKHKWEGGVLRKCVKDAQQWVTTQSNIRIERKHERIKKVISGKQRKSVQVVSRANKMLFRARRYVGRSNSAKLRCVLRQLSASHGLQKTPFWILLLVTQYTVFNIQGDPKE